MEPIKFPTHITLFAKSIKYSFRACLYTFDLMPTYVSIGLSLSFQHFQIQPTFPLGYFCLSHTFKSNLRFHWIVFVFPTLSMPTYVSTELSLSLHTFKSNLCFHWVVFVFPILSMPTYVFTGLSLSFHHFKVLTYVFILGYSFSNTFKVLTHVFGLGYSF